MRLKARGIGLGLFVLGMMAASSAWSGMEMSATETVRAVLEKAMEIQTRPDLRGPEHRRERAEAIRTLIEDNFLEEEMAKASLTSHWETLSSEERREFQELFRVLFQDSYTRMVLNFLGKETIDYRGEEIRGTTARVQTVILRANEHIPVDYDMVHRDGRWFIKDVWIDGVSIVNNYRSAFHRMILRRSFAGLLERMRLQRRAIESRAKGS